MPWYKPGWEHLNAVALEFYEGIQQGYGRTPSTRTPRQQELLTELLRGTEAFLYQLGHRYARFSGVSAADLVAEAQTRFIAFFPSYNPARGSISTFMHMVARQAMGKARYESFPISASLRTRERASRFIEAAFQHYRPSLTGSPSWHLGIAALQERGYSYRDAAALYAAVRGGSLSLEGMMEDKWKENGRSSRVEGILATDETEKEENRNHEKRVRRIKRALRLHVPSLSAREERILRMHLGLGVGRSYRLQPKPVMEMDPLAEEYVRSLEFKVLIHLKRGKL